MRIAIVSDHAAVALKAEVAAWLTSQGHEVEDLSAETDRLADYAEGGFRLAEHMAIGRSEHGVALCGSGVGISIAVNRHPACRCALVATPVAAVLSREHNDANVIAIGARIVDPDTAKACVAAFLATTFAGGRHMPRVRKLGAPPWPRSAVDEKPI